MLLEGAVFAVEGAVGGGFVAEMEVVHFDVFGSPVEEGAAVDVHAGVGIVVALAADAMPVGFGGAADEVVGEGVIGAGAAMGVVDEGLFFFGDAMFAAPAGEEDEEGGFGFAGEDEGFGAGAVLNGVAGRAEAARETCRTGAAGVAFFLGRRGSERAGGLVIGQGRWCGQRANYFVCSQRRRFRWLAGSELLVHSELIVKWRHAG